MAAGTESNFIIYEAEFFAGAYETIEQNINVFNADSRGAIRLVPQTHRGNTLKESFFTNVSGGLINRRDTTSVAAVTSSPLGMDDAKSPKLSRRIGPVEDTISAFKKIDEDPSLMSFILGQQVGPEMFQDHITSSILACDAALNGVAALEYDASGSDPTATLLLRTLALMGDKASKIVAWVMHSSVYFKLMESYVTDKLTNVTDVVVYGGTPPSLGRPVIVTDSTALALAGTTTYYTTLGLVAGGITVRESEQRSIETQTVLGKENITGILQGEYGITVSVKGFDYTGSANPNDATIGSSANWTQVASSIKACAGVRLVTNGS